MHVLGHAIARHLTSQRGLYSVELPESLAGEMVALVQCANTPLAPRRALLVSAAPLDPTLATVTIGWRQMLAWRTDEDRVFVWQRGLHEPDSSFQSVVRPFVSRRFPGAGGGECSLDLLIRACTRELWDRRGWPPSGENYDAFLSTATWVADILVVLFEAAGSMAGTHWSDRFLVHLASMFDTLDTGLAGFAGPLEPRHAWEIVRVAGLPLPAALASGTNPFLAPPEPFPASQMRKYTELWADIVETFLLRDGGAAEFLAALDREAVGTPKVSPWRGLDWSRVQALASDAPAPVVGAAVFTANPSPSLLSTAIPNTSAPDRPSWWGVTTEHLDNARTRLRRAMPLTPDDTRPGLLCLASGASGPFVLDTRLGTVAHQHTPTKWRTRVTLTSLGLRYKEDWQILHVSDIEPSAPSDGDAWIKPLEVVVELKGATVDQLQAAATAGDQLLVTFSLCMEYQASRDRLSGDLSGSWSPERKLKVTLDLRLRHSDQWENARRVETEIKIIVPSPYAPTVLISNGSTFETVGPDSEDLYAADAAASTLWTSSTPTILLDEEGRYGVQVYDGTLEPWNPAFRAVGQLAVDGNSLPLPTGAMFPTSDHDLDDGVVVTDDDPSHGGDVAVFRVKQRSDNVSSGILSAVRGLPAGRRPPAEASRKTVLGSYQDGVTRPICEAAATGLNSLYQIVIAASEAPVVWETHPGGPAPQFLFPHPAGFVLPGVGNGPSADLASSPAWSKFLSAMGVACWALGLRPGNENAWLSGLDPSVLGAPVVRDVLAAHCALLEAAAILSPTDRFWAAYPFSVLVVEGGNGPDFGQLRAIFLSPLHPARLAWGFAVAAVARQSKVDHSLLGLLEGWNIPATGSVLNPVGEARPLVAVPINPGSEQDFVGWSALAVLGSGGAAELPVIGAGQALPWGGRTGINARVVERALRDYLAVHHHINALEVDIRSVGVSPRSQEIDEALLNLLGGAELAEVAMLGGGTRVWDSLDRHGSSPTRDALFGRRRSHEVERAFEWRVYQASHPPRDTDVALVENATVPLRITAGTSPGVIGSLALRRFFTSDIAETYLDQNFLPADGEDILGLASLLRLLEAPGGEPHLCIRANPQLHGLGIGRGAQWEVLGTFNIDPSLLANLVAAVTSDAGSRLLWEWRPSWMVTEKKTTDLARRPYFVIARVPASLSMALHSRQRIEQGQAVELLGVLGRRGIGLAALNARGNTHESAAAGFFYAIQLLSSNKFGTPFDALASGQKPIVYGILPLDPVEPVLRGMADRDLERRADLLVLALSRDDDGELRLWLVPAEIKHHGLPSNPEPMPIATNKELERAREQLTDTVKLLRGIIVSLADTDDQKAGLRYLRRLALATLVDLAISLSPNPPPATERANLLATLLSGAFRIGLGDPILLWFAPGSIPPLETAAYVIDPHTPFTTDNLKVRELFIDPSRMPGLWWQGTVIEPAETEIRNEFDAVIRECFLRCDSTSTAIGANRAELDRMLGLVAALDTPATAPPESLAELSPVAPNSDGDEQPITPAPEADATPPDFPVTPADSAESRPQDDVVASPPVAVDPVTPVRPAAPRAVLGWTGLSNRWSLVGKLAAGDEPVAIDLDHPKTIGIFGFMGSGKSYLLGNLIESALAPIPGVSILPSPLAVVIFNYRRNASDRFELSSLAIPNDDPGDIARLASEYSAHPMGLRDLHVLCLPGELRPARLQEYGPLPASELFFAPGRLDVEDWELLMGEPGSEAVFARTIRSTLVKLREAGDITLDGLEHNVSSRLTGGSRAAARLRFDFVRRYLAEDRGANFANLLRPGRALIIDLRQPLFNKDDALRFFLVCANQISRVQGEFNKLIVFDEAHEYLSEEFGERMESRIRQMRHEGTSYVFATQDTGSIPVGISRFLTTRFVFNLGTRENVEDLEKVAPEFRGMSLLSMRPGHCLVQANSSLQGLFARPRELRVRPRVTRHGGGSRIFSQPPE
jgi:hypothetical protein